MKLKDAFLWLLVILVIYFAFIKRNSSTEYIPYPIIKTVKTIDTVRFVSHKVLPRYITEEERHNLKQIIHDTIKVDSLRVARIDTCLVFDKKTTIADGLFGSSSDTICLSVSYFTHPVNRFYVEGQSKSNFIIYKQQPSNYHRPSFWERIHLGIGVGYSLSLNPTKVYPSINLGIYYNIK